ncbi:MAG: SMP-30/gluconolactonase/LRE family protein [Acidimicrobiia bacterium]|nr:SMP-30/gluconolactonase/LRE family protein [Acidimicrobiia bacterium]
MIGPRPLALALGLATAAGVAAQDRTGADVVRLDPALDAIVSPDARVETLVDDYFGYTEGPVWVPDGPSGYLLFSDMSANRIYKWADGRLSVHLDRAGFTGTEFPDVRILNNGRLQVVILGTNGLTLDREGRLVMCAHGDRALVRLEKDGTRTVLADRYEGRRINGPNDVAMRSDGSFYFSDRGSALAFDSPARELPYTALFRWHEGTLQVLDTDPQVNGVAFSPDEKHLYVAGGPRIRRFEVRPDGTLANPRLFLDVTAGGERGGTDGMEVDPHGNLFTIGPGGVWIVSPSGTVIGRIRTPVQGTNVAFGDPDGRGLYITSARSLFYVRLDGRQR